MESKAIEVSDPQDRFLGSVSDLNLFMAGIGSGKSHAVGLISADFITNNPYLIQFIGANTYQQLSKSTLKRVFDVWSSEFGWKRDNDFVVDIIPPKGATMFHEPLKEYKNTISFENGALLFTASLDNYKAIDGTEFAVAHLDETKDTKEEAVKEVISTRLRQPGLWISGGLLYDLEDYNRNIASGWWKYDEVDGERVLLSGTGKQVRSWNPLFIYTSPAKVDWLNEWFELTDKYEEIGAKIHSKTDFFCHETEEKCIVISSTFHNEKNLPVGFIQKKLRDLKATPNLIDMLIYGSPIAKSGVEFIHQFNRLVHVKKVAFDPKLPIHLTLDFNVAPYMTGLCAQLTEPINGRRKLRLFREYCLPHPRNTTEDICSALQLEYGNKMKGLFYYGDPSGRNRQTVSKEYTDNYDVLQRKLKRFLNNHSDRVLTNHPAIIKSRDFVNNLFAGTYDIDVEIDESLVKFINDLEYAKEGLNGEMLKPVVKDKDTGRTYEKLGHCLDAFRYLVVSLFEKLYESL